VDHVARAFSRRRIIQVVSRGGTFEIAQKLQRLVRMWRDENAQAVTGSIMFSESQDSPADMLIEKPYRRKGRLVEGMKGVCRQEGRSRLLAAPGSGPRPCRFGWRWAWSENPRLGHSSSLWSPRIPAEAKATRKS